MLLITSIRSRPVGQNLFAFMQENSLVKIFQAREAMLPPEIEVRVSQIAAAFAFVGNLSEHFGKSFVNAATRFWSGDLHLPGTPDIEPEDDPHLSWRVRAQ